MKRSGLVLTIVGGVTAAMYMFAQAAEQPDKTYIVKHVLTGEDDLKFVTETSEVVAEVVKSFPISRTSKGQNGTTLVFREIRLYKPWSLSSKDTSQPAPESFIIGPEITCWIRSASKTQIHLEVTLSETKETKRDRESQLLAAETVKQRVMKVVEVGETVTLTWPSPNEGQSAREVQLTIVGMK